ncbi:hypothetical protein HNY73_020075 [Argiope bruennichi]|uniref:Uncharacterized protein n=1 Tax=Argiope bruennichi TaxID=94029 RepID=A0A8T0EA24_ARGBR|nr:hypothetical protein HNY73_020075 [Argiope bruennichi]
MWDNKCTCFFDLTVKICTKTNEVNVRFDDSKPTGREVRSYIRVASSSTKMPHHVRKMSNKLFWCLQTTAFDRNKVQVSWVDSKGLPNNCFTVESIWGLPQEQIQKIPLNGKISLNLKPQPEQYLLYHDLVLVHILLHEAHSLGNPFKEGITMEAGKTYNIFINQRVTERLPAPYQTNCTDYLKLWEKNDGFGPLTRKSCTEQCKMENMLETDGCVAQSISYPGNYTICNDEVILSFNPSREVSFSLHQELAYDLTAKCNNDVNCFYKDIYLHFIFNRLEVEKFLHQPRYENVEMFSYIGGYMGMWLGISLVALFDFAETMMSLGTYICRDKRKKKAIHSYY